MLGQHLPLSPYRLAGAKLVGRELVGADGSNIAREVPPSSLSKADYRLGSRLGYFACAMVFDEQVDGVLLRASLAATVGAAPWFAGRLIIDKDGVPDISLNNAGALLATGTSKTTLDQLLAATAVDTRTGLQRSLMHPFPNLYGKTTSPDAPMAVGTLVHLAGGGSVLWVSLNHVLGDFTSLQLFAEHWSAQYAAALERQRRQAGARPRHQQRPPPPPQQQQQQQQLSQAELHQPAGTAAPAKVQPLPCSRGPGEPCGPGDARACDACLAFHEVGAGTGGVADADATVVLKPGGVHGGVAKGASSEGAANTKGRAAPPPTTHPAVPFMDARWLTRYTADSTLVREGLRLLAEVRRPTTLLNILRVIFNMIFYMLQGGGVQTVMVHVPQSRLSELKALASRELQEARRDFPDQLRGVTWVSTLDALSARIMQVFHALPLHRSLPLNAIIVGNMRARSSPPLPHNQIGNILNYAVLRRVQPAACSLGHLAGVVRSTISKGLLETWAPLAAASEEDFKRIGLRPPINVLSWDSRPESNFFSARGPTFFINWRVEHGCWRFGSEPVRFFIDNCIKATQPMCNTVFTFPAHNGDGMTLVLHKHRWVWRQLAAAGGLRP